MPAIDFKLEAGSYGDLNDGPQICIMRLRQIKAIIQSDKKGELWPLAVVNIATCLEWFARSVVKHLIDYSAERINPNSLILRDLKINYGLVIQARLNNFSIGDIVAMSRNFSSFDEIEKMITDLTKEVNPPILARVQKSWAALIDAAFKCGRISPALVTKTLNDLFKKRHELVHGTPRYLAYDDHLSSLVSERELLLFIQCSLDYMTHVVSTLSKFTPDLGARSTYEMNFNQRNRLDNSEKALRRLEQSIEKRLANDADYLKQFKRAQHAWRTWRNREADFQTSCVWGPSGSGRPAIYMGFETTLSMDRLRSLERCLREMDANPLMG